MKWGLEGRSSRCELRIEIAPSGVTGVVVAANLAQSAPPRHLGSRMTRLHGEEVLTGAVRAEDQEQRHGEPGLPDVSTCSQLSRRGRPTHAGRPEDGSPCECCADHTCEMYNKSCRYKETTASMTHSE